MRNIYNGVIFPSFNPAIFFFNSIPDNHCQQVARQLGKSHAQWLLNKMKLSTRYCRNFEFIENFRKEVCLKHCKYMYKDWVFFLGDPPKKTLIP